MLLYVGTEPITDAEALKELNLTISKPDERIIDNFKRGTVPGPDSLNLMAHDLAEYIGRKFNEQKVLFEQYTKEFAEWKERRASISEEEYQRLKEKGTDDEFAPYVEPAAVEDYIGVLIGEDVPNYIITDLVTFLRQVRMPVYFVYTHNLKKTTGYKETDVEGVLEPIDEYTGDVKKTIIKLYN